MDFTAGRFASEQALRVERDRYREQAAQLQARCGELAASLSAANDALAARDAHIAGLQQQLAQADALADAVRRSSSWRLTAPVRAAARAARGLRRSAYVGAAHAARAAYQALPLPFATKHALKQSLFQALPGPLSRTGAYRRWQQSTAAPAQPVEPAEADGRWEWEAYPHVRARLDAADGLRRAPSALRQRAMPRLQPAELGEAAARLALPPPGARPDVSVIIPVFNELATTLACLQSVAQSATARTFEVIVANDASRDDTAAILADVRHLRLVNQPENLGFLRNCNRASEHARGRFIVFLNNDTQVSPNWLTALAEACDAPGVGAAGPRMVFPNGALQEAGVRLRRYGSVEMIGQHEDPDDPRWCFPREVEYVSGACLMLRTAVFRELGGFNEALAPAYCEDLELCLRLHRRGLRIIYTPAAEIVHELSRTSEAIGQSYKHTLIARNMQQVAQWHQEQIDALDDLRVIAFDVPQLHPAPPPELQRPVAREQQWALASRYGVDGFCYPYRGRDRRHALQQPMADLFDGAVPAHPFCLCWAQDAATEKRNGRDRRALTEQGSRGDDLAAIGDIARTMAHPAYIRVGGKPVLLVYRVDLLPDFSRTAETWRAECRRLNLGEIYLLTVQAGVSFRPSDYGCDAALQLPDCGEPGADYADVAVHAATRPHPGFKQFRAVTTGLDAPDFGPTVERSSPGAFQAWVEAAVADTKRDFAGDERLLFVHGWGEGADRRFGHSYLEALHNGRRADWLRPHRHGG